MFLLERNKLFHHPIRRFLCVCHCHPIYGIDTRGWKPEVVTQKDLAAAATVVTLGCALPDKEAVASKVMEWNDTPSVGQNYQAARDYLVQKVQLLVDDLAKQQAGAKGKKKKR